MRVLTFQTPEVAEQLIRDKEFIFSPSSYVPKKENKTKFYQEHLQTGNIPIYSFASLLSREDHLGYPISLSTLSTLWGSLIDYFSLKDRVMIELEIPSSEGVLGLIGKKKIIRSVWESNDATEFVTSELRREWVRELYTFNGFRYSGNEVEYRSQVNSDPYALFKGVCKFSRKNQYSQEHMWTKINSDYTTIENLQRLTIDEKELYISREVRRHLNEEFNPNDFKAYRETILKLPERVDTPTNKVSILLREKELNPNKKMIKIHHNNKYRYYSNYTGY